jgi:hypothetical protein
VQILTPTEARFEALRPLLDESLDLVRTRWSRRKAPTLPRDEG